MFISSSKEKKENRKGTKLSSKFFSSHLEVTKKVIPMMTSKRPAFQLAVRDLRVMNRF